jgi:diguanylate cyclase (GGDEF)-like protein
VSKQETPEALIERLQRENRALRETMESAAAFQSRLKALHAIGIELQRTADVDELCRVAVESARSRLGFDRLGIWLVEDTATMRGTFGIDEHGSLRDERMMRLPITSALVRDGIISRIKPFHLYEQTPLYNDRAEPIGEGWIAVGGLWDGDRVIGSISVDNLLSGAPPPFYLEELLVLFSTLLGQLTTRKRIEIENRRLYEEAQRRAEEAETLRHAGAWVAATLDQHEAIDRILAELARVVPYDRASVQLREGNDSVVVGGRGFSRLDAVIGRRFPVATSIVYQQRRALIRTQPPSADTPTEGALPEQIQSWLAVPMIFQDAVIGMITLDSYTPHRFDEQHMRLVGAFADQVTIALENARLFARVQQLATTDSLTGLYNRGHLFELGRYHLLRMQRTPAPLSAILIDIDHFKRINDTYGHLAGDFVLRAAAEQCRSVVRAVDMVARYGGEEFLILLPDADHQQAIEIAARIQSRIAQARIAYSSIEVRLTVSIGVATMPADQITSLDALIDQADQRLYMAKESGRNMLIGENRIQ